MWSLLLAACSRPTLPDPVIERATPSFAWNGEPSTISVVGRNFLPLVEIDARARDATVNPAYVARLVGEDQGVQQVIELLGVGIVDDEHLTATVPEGLPPGLWTLEVESPSGATAALTDGFRVTDQQAARLSVSTSVLSYTVGEAALLDLTLLDLDGEVVPLPFRVLVVPTGTGASPPTLDAGTLADADRTPSGDGVRGNLVDGRATVSVTSNVPGVVDVIVAPADPYSPVVADEVAVRFDSGDELTVLITLPEGVTYRAGESYTALAELRDQFGNPVEATGVEVGFDTTCSRWSGSLLLDGPTQVTVTPTAATTDECPVDALRAQGPGTLGGQSAGYEVLPGAPARFEVSLFPGFELRAGDRLSMVVEPQDAFGNPTPWSGVLNLQDSQGGMVDAGCLPGTDELWLCSSRVTRAGPAVVVVATGDDGVSGASEPVTILPDDEVASIDLRVGALATAGAPLPIDVVALDAFGNVIPAVDTSGLFVLTDELGDASCVRVGVQGDGSAAFECTFTVARPDAVVSAALDGFVADAPLAVQNGGLGLLVLGAPADVTAGDEVVVTVTGHDAWGNPYLVQDDPVVVLRDDGGSFGEHEVALDASGAGEVTSSFTLAGRTRLRGAQAGVELGASDEILVAPGVTAAVRTMLQGPWAWVDEPTAVTVESVDAWGNRTGLDAAGLLTSSATSAASVPVPLVNGVGVVTFTWPEAAIPDELVATVGVWQATLEVVVVRDCPGGPSAALAFDGWPVGVTCATATDGGQVVADLGGSAPGSLPLADHAAALVGGVGALASAGLVPLALPSVGPHEVLGLAIDTAGCADEVAGDAWSAPDDGSPAGPIAVTASAPSIPVFGAATIEVSGATDCRRDPAAGATVYLASSGGELPGTTATGAGLVVVTDAAGDAATVLDTASGGLGGATLRVVAASASGGGRGELLLPVTGDDVRPIVVDATPTGASTDLVDTFTLTFSEPLDPAFVVPANFAVTGRTVVGATAAGAEVTITVDASVDGAAGAVVLSASSTIRDASGNRLAGDWADAPAIWRSGFGGAAPGATAPACGAVTPASLRIRPDGDDGAGEEADRVEVAVLTAAAPSWWVVEVRDDAGALVFVDWEIPVSAADTVRWHARDLTGGVVPAGRYELTVAAADGLGNRWEGCVLPITVVAR
jgi:hypothetical protein